MEIFLIKLLQFMLAISILVLLHEGGHFFFSKLFGVRVEKFFLFFDPWFHLFQFKPRKSDTTYGIGWLPLGGYCKISGMIDESFDTDQMQKPAEPWEFRSKPAWQRLLIMIGGVLVNFLLALFLYAMCLFTWGDDYVKPKDMPLGMKFNKEAKALGFQDRDILVGTDQGEFKKFGADMFREMATAREAYVIRDGKQVSIDMPGDLDLLNMFKSTPPFMTQFIEARVDSVLPGSLAEHMGFRKGDIITSLNGKRITVTVGNIISTLAPEALERISNREYNSTIKSSSKFVGDTEESIRNRKLNFQTSIDIRGERLSDALEIVERFIDDAVMLNMQEVKILHGKGNGILKEEIRKYLRTVGGVASCTDEDIRYGGSGITVVHLE